jgi:hypothetical protein
MKVFDPLLTWAAARYQAAVGPVLVKHGLRYEDLYDPLLNQVGGGYVAGWTAFLSLSSAQCQ